MELFQRVATFHFLSRTVLNFQSESLLAGINLAIFLSYLPLAQFHNTPLLPHKNICITIVRNYFSWDMKMSQEKSKTMPM